MLVMVQPEASTTAKDEARRQLADAIGMEARQGSQ
jgi:hypothetical protein